MKIRIEITREQLKELVINKIREQLPYVDIDEKEVKIETKSTQNYKSEWEIAEFRAIIEVNK